MSRNNLFFESYLEKTGRILSREFGLKVVLEGNRACTDGETLWLPMMEDVEDELRADMDGFLDHEVAHIKFTDFKELKKPKRILNRFHKELFNAIEDSRIEILMVKEYSGSALNLDRLNQKWGAKVREVRPQMPWPIRLILSIREIYDNKTPSIDPQIEPIIAAIYPKCVALRKCKNTKELLDATTELINDINLAREALSKGLPPISDEKLEEALKHLRGESPVALDPERDKRESQKAVGNEQYDPATKEIESDSEGEEGEESGEKSGEESGEESAQGKEESENSQEGQAGISAEQEGSEKGDGNSQDGKSDKNSDSAESESGEKSKPEAGSKSSDEIDNRNKNLETHESVTGEEGDESKNKKSQAQADSAKPEFDGTQELEERKNYATWKDSATEQKMLNDKVDAKSEFDSHVFSSESYMEIELEKAIAREPEVRTYRGYYWGRDEKINDKDISLPFSREYDEVIDFTGEGNTKEYADRKLKVMKHIRPITNRLERVLKVKENAKMRPERERGNLNTRALSQMIINPNYRTPFKEYTKTDTTNVAVTLVIDCSGSMQGDQIEVARQTGLALAEALKGMNISCEVLGFNTSSNEELARRVENLSEAEVKRFNRFGETLRLMIFKRFESNNLTGICKAEAGGANADGESIIWAAKRLALRKEKRKILIVLSDGQPAYGGANHTVLAGDLKRVIKMLPKAGIEPVGIGIQTDDPSLFYPDWLRVDDLSKLSSVVVGKLARLLEKGLD